MICNNCGNEFSEEYDFCPNCGAPKPVQQVAPQGVISIIDKVQAALTDGMFLAACVLMSIASAASVVLNSFNVIYILTTVFMWVAYSKAASNSLESTHIKNLSGMVYAVYIINYVAYGILFIATLILTAFLIFADSIEPFFSEVINGLQTQGINVSEYIEDGFLGFLGVFLLVVFVIVCVIGIIINVVCYRKIHKFVKSVYQSMQSGTTQIDKVNAAKNWLIVLAVGTMLDAFSNEIFGLLLIVPGCGAAALILCALIIKRHFLKFNDPVDIQ